MRKIKSRAHRAAEGDLADCMFAAFGTDEIREAAEAKGYTGGGGRAEVAEYLRRAGVEVLPAAPQGPPDDKPVSERTLRRRARAAGEPPKPGGRSPRKTLKSHNFSREVNDFKDLRTVARKSLNTKGNCDLVAAGVRAWGHYKRRAGVIVRVVG